MAPVNGSSPTENVRSTKTTDLLLGDISSLIKPSSTASNGTNNSRSTEFDRSLVPTYRQLLLSVGEDPDRDGLRKTPERAAKAIWFFTTGYRQSLKGKLLLSFDSPE